MKRNKSIPSIRCSSSFTSPGREVSVSVLGDERIIFPSRLDQPRVPGSIEPSNKIPPYRQHSQWDPDNTSTIKMGMDLANRSCIEQEIAKKKEEEEKMRRHEYERNTRRYCLHNRQCDRQELMRRAGQPSSPGSACESQPMQRESPARHVPTPADHLESLERFCRAGGRSGDARAALVPNGSLTLEGAFAQPPSLFAVDPARREHRRAMAGGALDRLHMSDGSVRIALAPPLAGGDLRHVAVPIPLRTGGLATISQRAAPRAARQAFAPASAASGLGDGDEFESLPPPALQSVLRKQTWAGLFSFAEPPSPEAWRSSAGARAAGRCRSELMLKRPDLEAAAAYYAVRKLVAEQGRLQETMRDVQARRQLDRQRLERRRVLRETLELRCGGDGGGGWPPAAMSPQDGWRGSYGREEDGGDADF